MKTIADKLYLLDKGDRMRPLQLPPNEVIRRDFNLLNARWHDQLRPAALQLPGLTGNARQLAMDKFERDTDSFVVQTNNLVQLIERDSETRTFWLRASQIALVALALSGTVSLVYLMVRLIIAPVRRLQNGMRRM